MSAAETEDVEGEDPPEDHGDEQADEEERPPIEDEERADVDLDGIDFDAVEDEAGAGADEDDETGEDTDADEAPESGQQAAEMDPLPEGQTWGDQYVEMLALLLGEVSEAHDGDKDAEEIAELARSPPVCLDDNVDRWLEQSGMGTDLPPGKAVAIGTAGLVAVVILTETDLGAQGIERLTEEIDAL